MEKETPSQPPDTITKISDSNYGSLINESSSSCLSLLSESDFLDEPSTSGCSSEMASHLQNREKKRQKVKEFLRELKAMVPNQSSGTKLGTLSTLDFVVSSMRKITEEQKQDKGQVFKAPSSEPVTQPSLQCSDSVDFRNVNDGIVLNTQSELTVAVSLKNHVVLHTSTALMDQLGYPHAWWKGRLLKDFVHKKDLMTVNSYINSESSDSEPSSGKSSDSRSQSKKKESSKQQHKQFFYARIRRFRSLSSGFSLSSAGTYMFFKVMVTCKPPDSGPDVSGDEQKTSKRCMMLYLAPMTSPYEGGQLPADPEQRTFSLRHSLFCTYTYTHANTVALLGFLPQDIVGTSIFDYYHPDDLPQLFEIYKKAMLSMGQPFKSGMLRMRTRNGTYVKTTTEWSSFMNPWDHKLEFIIAQHTVVKPPDNPNVFEENPDRSADRKSCETSRKLIAKITEMLQKPMTVDGMPLTPSDSGGAVTSSPNAGGSTPTRDTDKSKEKSKNESSQGPTSSSDISSSIMDEKSISSLYNQVNYSLNIKKFLLSHPKAFPVSDEDSSTDVVQKDDSEEDLNEEEEMQVEIPVCRPPSCGSSTQVHVSEQGFHEEVPSPPSFGGEDPNLTREALDNQRMLTEDSLRRHTKAQELLYLQEASKEQPHLFHLRSRRQGPHPHRVRQKRSRPSGHEDTTEVFKFARNAKGQRGGSGPGGTPGLFMSNFPITAVDVQPTAAQPTNAGMTSQGPSMVGMVPGPFQPGVGMMPQLTMLPIDPATGLTMQSPLQPFLPSPPANMQWPYYPQSGYSLLPQVMAGFYQPLLQAMPMSAVTQASPFGEQTPGTTASAFSRPGHQQQPQKTGQQPKNGTDSDHLPSSAEDTSSSIQYLMDAVSANNSSPNEDAEEKMRQRLKLQAGKLPRRRLAVPPWIQTINWTPELRLLYKMPVAKEKSVLKKDREALKKMVQSEQAKLQLEMLLEEVDSPDYIGTMEEEADYMFYPEGRSGDAAHTSSEGEGEKTPQQVLSPAGAFESSSSADQEADASGNKDLETTEEKKKQYRDKDCHRMTEDISLLEDMITEELPTVEVVMTEAPQHSALEETTSKTAILPETLEKVHSPASEGGSSSSGKDGSAEGEGSASSPSPTPCTLSGEGEGPKSHEGAMETKSPKDGCSSDDGRSDVGSDKGSENSSNNSRPKSEDAQSSSSKVSSNLTPSEERSTEDAGSSLKESDMSTPKGSVASSSNDKMSNDSGAESTSTPMPDILEKLFTPLKIRMCLGEWGGEGDEGVVRPSKVMTLPYWQQEAHLSQKVALQYSLRPTDLASVLANDRRRLASMTQPHDLSCQLLELLHEMEGQGHGKGGLPGNGESSEKPGDSSGSAQAESSSSQLMQPPKLSKATSHPLKKSSKSHRQHKTMSRHASRSAGVSDSPRGSSDTAKALAGSASTSADPNLSRDAPPSGEAEDRGGRRDPACVESQLLDKLHSLTQGQRSEDWPGDIIMNRVFLPVDLVSTSTVSGRAQETEILDTVD